MDVSDLSPFPESAAPADTPRIDAGPSWQEQDGLLRDLWLQNHRPEAIAEKLGRSMAAIMTRAARLGLPRRTAPGRKPGRRIMDDSQRSGAKTRAQTRHAAAAENIQVAPQTALRVCLMCLTKFQSLGRHNRICASCKNSSEYESARALPEIHLPTS